MSEHRTAGISAPRGHGLPVTARSAACGAAISRQHRTPGPVPRRHLRPCRPTSTCQPGVPRRGVQDGAHVVGRARGGVRGVPRGGRRVRASCLRTRWRGRRRSSRGRGRGRPPRPRAAGRTGWSRCGCPWRGCPRPSSSRLTSRPVRPVPSSSTAHHRPAPRISLTPGQVRRRAASRARARRAAATAPGARRSPAARPPRCPRPRASGLPPNVLPCSPGPDHAEHVPVGGHGRHRQDAAAERLAEDAHVGLRRRRGRTRTSRPARPEAGLDLVGHEQHVALGAQLRGPPAGSRSAAG